MLQAGRSIGLAASGVTFSLWLVFLFFNPYGNRGINADSYAIVGLMLGLALVGHLVRPSYGNPVSTNILWILCIGKVEIGSFRL